MHHFNSNDVDNFLYWITWGFLIAASKVFGFFTLIAEFINSDIKLPVHEVKYFPQLEELIPALVIAAACAIVSAIAHKIVGIIWNKFFPKKQKI